MGEGALSSETVTPPKLGTLRRWDLPLVIVVASALYLPFLGSYSLYDPWEGHYAEVARRMLEERDLLYMQWQNENFFSKPPLTFWIMAAGMRAQGVGEDGGYSGELGAATHPEWGLRLPFALFGIVGLAFLFTMLARLKGRRVAYLATLILGTTPYYFLISRQAITDMPMAAMLIGSMCLFVLAIHDDPERRLPSRRLPLPKGRSVGLNAYHAFLAVFGLLTLGQIVYFTFELQGTRMALFPGVLVTGPSTMLPFYLGFALTAWWTWRRTHTVRQVHMYWFYVIAGLSVLAKGPVAPAVAGLTILTYLILTGEWKLLRRVEIPRGILITVMVALPWHVAMYSSAGRGWYNEYVGTHLVRRAFVGVHQVNVRPETFSYFVDQLGTGMWPWIVFVPLGLVFMARMGRPQTREDKVRLLFGIWAVMAFFFFSMVPTKYHHYILPAVPAFAALAAFWWDDVLAGRARRVGLSVTIALSLLVLLCLDVVPHQENFPRLFIYRYDRYIPRQAPWNLDYEGELFWFAVAFVACVAALWVRPVRKYAIYGIGAATVAFTVFANHMIAEAAPHFGQRPLFEIYYKKRNVHGVDLEYRGLRELYEDWAGGEPLEVECFVPETLQVGDPMRVGIRAAGEEHTLLGEVSRLGENRFWIDVPAAERQRIAHLVDRGRTGSSGRRFVSVNADRLLSKQYWRGEAFYAGGEMWNRRYQDTTTVFHEFYDTDGKMLLEYLNARKGQGRKFWVVAEKGRMASIRSQLPTQTAKETFREEDQDVSYFFSIASFTL